MKIFLRQSSSLCLAVIGVWPKYLTEAALERVCSLIDLHLRRTLVKLCRNQYATMSRHWATAGMSTWMEWCFVVCVVHCSFSTCWLAALWSRSFWNLLLFFFLTWQTETFFLIFRSGGVNRAYTGFPVCPLSVALSAAIQSTESFRAALTS